MNRFGRNPVAKGIFFSMAWAVACLAQDTAVSLEAYHADDAYQRWRDIATYLYDSAQMDPEVYANEASVTVSYTYSAGKLSGVISGNGLKPNFAYQLKLNGKPTLAHGADGDDATNEAIGYAGRWWVSQIDGAGVYVDGWNSTDTEYETWRASDFTDGTYDYVFFGYLLFDFFITDAAGAGEKEFVLDSSYHVLWKTSQATPEAGVDSEVTVHTVVVDPASVWYSKKRRTVNVGIFAEWEPDRALPEQLVLPAGTYNASLFLTEESFHETAPDSGSWATAMACDTFEFEITPPSQHDLAVSAVTVPDSVALGTAQNVTVTVTNNGASDEVASVVLVDQTAATEIDSADVVLAAGETLDVDLTWFTSGVALGEHVLVAEAVVADDENPDNDTASATTQVFDPANLPAMSAAIAVTAGAVDRKYAAVATVAVTDADGAPVAGASVVVQWDLDGKLLLAGTGTTDAAGVATVVSPLIVLKKDAPGVFTGTVVDVAKEGYTYDGEQPSASASCR